MTQELSPCPACGSAEVLFSARRQEYLCEACGHRWPFGQPAAVAWPPGLEPADLPIYLAAPLASLLAERHPRVRLHWLVDCAEIAVRWGVAVALAEVLHANAGALPEPVVARLREQIERPTLGKWLGILEALSAARPAEPLLAAGVFELYRDAIAPRFRGEGEGGTLETSLLLLRNHLAHGAGLRTEAARALLATHEPGVFDLLRAVARATGGTMVLAIEQGKARSLAGPRPGAVTCPEGLRAVPDGPWLVGASTALPLLPLAAYGPVRLVSPSGRLEERPGDPAAQLFQRADRERLSYVPLGRDEAVSQAFDVAAFRALFQLDVAPTPRRTPGEVFHWQDFLREAREEQEDLVGRVAELATLKRWLKGRDTRREGVAALGWVFGGPGLGKSLLMAKAAADLGGSKPEQQGLYYHRFRAGDGRNSLRAFLRGLLDALADWVTLPAPATAADADEADDDPHLLERVRARLARVAPLPPPDPRAPAPRFLVLVDGLDEVLPHDRTLPARLRELALPGTVWLVAGRPEPALQQAFAGPGCEPVFPGGLPPMSETDIRAMLEQGLDNARHGLVARDEDTADGVRNPFVERVVACADGLPLYVHLLLEDLRNGRLSVHDEQRLPAGLMAYYDALMDRVGLSDLKRDLPLLVAVLARAEEPLDRDALAVLLADVPGDAPRYAERVQSAERAGTALLRAAPTADGTEGLTLYHQSFREYLVGRPASGDLPAVAPAPALAGTVQDAGAKLCRLAQGWAELPSGNLRNHLFRWGVRYALRWQGEAGRAAARRRLTDFVFLQAFTKEMPSIAIRGLVTDYETVLNRLPDGPERNEFRLWEAFFREREYILRRGDERWPAYKILLQLAVEHADDSPVTRAAEAWLAQGHCDWVWLRNPQRVAQAVPDPCLRVLEGHLGPVFGARVLPDGRILSWSHAGDYTLRLWDGHTGAPLATLAGHTDFIRDVKVLGDGRILSWEIGTLRLWDGVTGAPLVTLDEVAGFDLLPDGRILSWSGSWDRTLRLRDGRTGALLASLAGHTDFVVGARGLDDGRILSWAFDKTLRMWDGQSDVCVATLVGHTGPVQRAQPLSDGRILSWAVDEMRLWDCHTGAPLATLTGYVYGDDSVHILADGLILSWSGHNTLRFWDSHTGAEIATVGEHTGEIEGLQVLTNGCILAWSDDRMLRLWNGRSGVLLATLAGHTGKVRGARLLPDGRILSWSDDQTLRLWDGCTGAPIATLRGHTDYVSGAQILPDGRILSWSDDRTLRLWDGQSGAPLATLAGHTGWVKGAEVLADGRILSWSADHTLRLWNGHAHTSVSTPRRHTGGVAGVEVLDQRRVLSWGRDHMMRLWNGETGTALATVTGGIKRVEVLRDGRTCSVHWDDTVCLWDSHTLTALARLVGHTARIRGVRLLADGRMLSWSADRTLRLWDGCTGAPIATLRGHASSVTGVQVLADGRILSWCWGDHTLRLWDGQSGAPLAILAGHTDSVEGAEVLPDGRILSWSADRTLRLWDGCTGAPIATLRGHASSVTGVQVLADGRILSWCWGDHTLRLWDGQSGAPLAILAGHTDSVEGAEVLPDGRMLSWSADRTLRLWDGHTGVPLTTLPGHKASCWDVQALPDGRIFASHKDWTYRLWDGESGAPLSGPIRNKDCPWLHPELLHYKLRFCPHSFSFGPHRTRHCVVQGQSAAWWINRTGGVATNRSGVNPVCWQASCHGYARALLVEGVLVVALEDGSVFCLQFHRGDRRISLTEYAQPD